MEIKTAFGVGSLVLGTVSYYPYVRDILSGKTKPHAFSWLVWAILSAIAFIVQVLNNGGAGAWLLGLSAIATFMIFILSLKRGEKDILLADYVSLVFAGIAIALWVVTETPLLAILLICAIDLVGGFFPTFRKSFYKPQEETVSLYFLYAISLLLSIVALENFDLINALYQATFILVNLSMVFFLLIRRAQT